MAHTITYSRTNLGDSRCNNDGILKDGANAKNNYKRDFTRSGDDGSGMGTVTRIHYEQWFRTESSTALLGLKARIIDAGGGWYLTSPVQTMSLSTGWSCLSVEFDVSSLPYGAAGLLAFSQVVVVCDWNANQPRVIRTIANGSFPAKLVIEYTTVAEDCDGADEPTLGTPTFSDTATCPNWEDSPLALFGKYIQRFSKPQISFGYTIDDDEKAYPHLFATVTTAVTSGETVIFADSRKVTARSGTITLDLPILGDYSAFTLTRHIEYPDGVHADSTAIQTILAYVPPVIELAAERWDYDADAQPVQDDVGRYVWFNGTLSVTALNGVMPWKCKIDGWNTEQQQDTPASGTEHQIASDWTADNDTFEHTLTNARTGLTGEAVFDGGSGWWFSITATDALGSTTIRVNIEQISPFFDVEADGVAVGMMSTAGDGNKKFEVAEDYAAELNGSVSCGTLLNVRCGRTGQFPSNAGNSVTDMRVTFDTPFPVGVVPYVVAGFVSDSGAGAFGRCSLAVLPSTTSNTGFSVRLFNGDTSSRRPYVEYIAFANLSSGSTNAPLMMSAPRRFDIDADNGENEENEVI